MNTEAHKKKLLDLREELLQLEQTSEEAAGAVVLDQSRMGRLTRMDALQAQAMSKETLARRKQKTVAINRALQRLSDGVFGNCIKCSEAIDPRRLDFDPSAELCMRCASQSPAS